MPKETTEHYELSRVESFFKPDNLISEIAIRYISEVFLYALGFFFINGIVVYLFGALGFLFLFPIGLIEMYVMVKILFKNVDRIFQTRIAEDTLE